VSGKYFNYDTKELRSSEESYDEAEAKRFMGSQREAGGNR
jgi:hypothetical protein